MCSKTAFSAWVDGSAMVGWSMEWEFVIVYEYWAWDESGV